MKRIVELGSFGGVPDAGRVDRKIVRRFVVRTIVNCALNGIWIQLLAVCDGVASAGDPGWGSRQCL